MRFLVDNALSPQVSAALKQLGHDSVHVRDIGLRDATDLAIFIRATEDDRHIISADTDFGTLAVKSGQNVPSVMLLRIQPSTVADDIQFVVRALESFQADLLVGCVLSVQRTGIRVRSLPMMDSLQ